MKKVLILFLFLIIISILYLITLNENYFDIIKEKFTNFPLLIYKVEHNPKNVNIYIDYFNFTDVIIKTIINDLYLNIIRNNNEFQKQMNNSLILTDVFTYNFIYKNNNNILSIINEDKYALFIKSKNTSSNESFKHIVETKQIIGYYNDLDIKIIAFICITLNINKNNLQLKKLEYYDNIIINKDYYKNNKINILFVLTSLQNNEFISKIDNNFLLDFIQYEDIILDDNINKLKFFLPYCKLKNINLSISFPKYKDFYSIKTCLSFDMLLCGNKIVENDDDLDNILKKIIKNIQNFDNINYYTMYFKFFKQTFEYLDKKNKHIIKRDNLRILEQFDNNIVTFNIIPKNNIDGFYNIDDNTLTINITKIDNIPLTLNSTIILNNQNRNEENGNYYVIYIDNEQSILKKTKHKVTEDEVHDYGYECYNHSQIKSIGACLSDYDELGKPKTYITYWDRRCSSNDDCPFYQKNKNYKNYRGGCLDNGMCELPLGLKKVSWRKYDKNSKAICYNCKDDLNPFCCEEQNDKKIYPELKSADYAFPLDSFDRMNQLKESKIKWFNF